MNRCKKLEDLPVVSEWQNAVFCPNCCHYSDGRCSNPGRLDENSICPFDNQKLPIKLVDGEAFKYAVGQSVLVEFAAGIVCNAKVINRKANEFGNLYQVDWSEALKKVGSGTPWMLEKFVHGD